VDLAIGGGVGALGGSFVDRLFFSCDDRGQDLTIRAVTPSCLPSQVSRPFPLCIGLGAREDQVAIIDATETQSHQIASVIVVQFPWRLRALLRPDILRSLEISGA
jgi:hypothetical protein